ncbi:insulinase family protein [Novosphingobium umbonatum]|uniref:Insulinase family protein n=1 Tax=Novosphingobium umbonatum TaxID=1908524 RepID=A0A3S2USU2_9SPHN|nr:pitrilysin family protein [Novosphingobium umbonatum]RVU05382.1 insulinase family protein [Novosphingobium umbonatum]
MRQILPAPMLALSLALVAQPALAAPAPKTTATPAQPATAKLADLVRAVDIPYERFQLANGLTVLVHTDRKAPIIGVTTYYRIGSKHEPRGKTGFAHLYEHLFFGGSENVPNFDIPLEGAGSTATNGSTWYDRTNYVETVPKGALDLALFLESDRMGHLLGAVTQDKLDKQRGVVQNEKRQGDNQPYGLTRYAQTDGLFPVGHPYRHQTIGSMADLDAASLGDVRAWFKEHYGPNNAVLVLSGDIDAATARPLMEKYFGDIPAGPAVKPVVAGPVTLKALVRQTITDNVATTRLVRLWSGPGLNHKDTAALQVGMSVLGGLASSRLDNALVRGKQVAVSVSAELESYEQVSVLEISMDVKPGVSRAVAEAALDAEIAKYLASGPNADEVKRAATREVSGQIGALEVVGGFGGKGATLAEGLLYSGDPAAYKRDLAAIASVTPAQAKAALNTWLKRPVLAIATVPGKRTMSGDQLGGWGDEAQRPAPKPDAKAPVPPVPQSPPRSAPPVAPVGELAFAAVEHATLSNGIPVSLARRSAVPKVVINLAFDAGIAADSLNTAGTQGLMLSMLKEGTTSRDATQVLEEEERLGASLESAAGMDTTAVTLSALSANLAPSLALMADVVLHPAFAPSEVERVKQQRLARLAQTLANPQGIAIRAINPVLFGKDHPYGLPADGLGDAASLKALNPQDLRAAHAQWLRPDLARITVVGDIAMGDLLPQLERAFGQWAKPASPKPVKAVSAAAPTPNPRIILIDRPGSPQSVIVAGRVLPLSGRDGGQEALDLANEVLGQGLLSRLNADIREDKGWSYGVQSVVRQPLGARSLLVVAPVQTDRTGDAIKAIITDMKALPAAKPVTEEELQRVTDGNIRGLPNRFETNAQVLGAIAANERFGRPDDYYTKLPALYRSIDAKLLNEKAAQFLQPEGLTYVVVGDRAKVEAQVKELGLPVEVR